MEAIFNFLVNNYPAIAFGIVIFIISWKMFKFYSRFTKAEEQLEKLPCTTHGDDISTFKQTLGLMQDLKESIRKIEEYIIKQDPNSMDKLVRKCSPLKLTSFGVLLLKESGGQECIDNNEDFFLAEIQKLQPKVALDVETYSLSVLNDNLKDEKFNQIKNYIFNSPSPKEFVDSEGAKINLEIKIESILMVMSIYLRDKYLDKHAEIDTSQF